MRIILEISSEKEIKLPIQYNRILQGFIYNNLSDKDYREFIHSQGYQLDNKKFKFFTYSRLLGKFNLYPRPNEIGFESPVKLVVSSAVEQFITDLAETLIKADFLFLGSSQIEISSQICQMAERKHQMRSKCQRAARRSSCLFRTYRRRALYTSACPDE